MHTLPNHQQAFSLIELVVVVAILLIASMLALPAWQEFLRSNRSQSLHDQLKGTLHLARFYSITLHREIEVCGTLDGNSCAQIWENGWLVRAANTELPMLVTRLPQPMHLHWNRPKQAIRFTPLGHSSNSNGTFTFCDENAKAQWKIILNRQGRARTAARSELSEADCANS